MKRLFTSCAAVIVGILLVAPVHAGPGHSNKGSGQHSRHRSGHHRRVFRPLPWQHRWQWLPQQFPDVLVDDPNRVGDDLNPAGDDLNPAGDDLTLTGPQPRRDVRGGNVARPMANPKDRARGSKTR
jgi:hypothetical protein